MITDSLILNVDRRNAIVIHFTTFQAKVSNAHVNIQLFDTMHKIIDVNNVSVVWDSCHIGLVNVAINCFNI